MQDWLDPLHEAAEMRAVDDRDGRAFARVGELDLLRGRSYQAVDPARCFAGRVRRRGRPYASSSAA
jgi:hypothetical protein